LVCATLDGVEHLLNRLMRHGLPQDEVVQVVTSKFSHGVGLSATEFGYGDAMNESRLLLIYDEDDALTAIDAVDVEESRVQEIDNELAQEAVETSTYIRRVVLFSSAPVAGWWRHRDNLQVLPVPVDAPRPDQLLADHPFYLEFRVRRAHHHGVRALRDSTGERLNELLLNAFCNRGIRRLVHTHGWFLTRRPDLGEENWTPEVTFAQSLYSFPSMQAYSDDFTDTSGMDRIALRPESEYFTRFGPLTSDPLALPDRLSEYLDTFAAANEDWKGRVYRSAYWLSYSREARRFSSSASLAALVQAIEALIPPHLPGTSCPTCKRPSGVGPTQLFHNFVESNLPGLTPPVRRALYKARSGILHGSILMPRDEGVLKFHGLQPEDGRQWELEDAASLASQHCLLGTMNRLQSGDLV
jgi:hypothetical protein